MFIPEESEIREFVDKSIDYWMKRVKIKEPPEYAEFKQKPEVGVLLEFLEGFEKHFITIGACCGVAMITGFFKLLEKKDDVSTDTGNNE